jgi:hypothetical protein
MTTTTDLSSEYRELASDQEIAYRAEHEARQRLEALDARRQHSDSDLTDDAFGAALATWRAAHRQLMDVARRMRDNRNQAIRRTGCV